jgi:hypothetical protein
LLSNNVKELSAEEKLYSVIPIFKYSSNNKKIIEILGITVNHTVTILGLSSYTSGDQLCNGAAPTLKKKPIKINTIPKLIPCKIAIFSVTKIKL